MMKHHRLTAEEAIGWLRIVRPGSVIGPQQQYMKDMQARMWREGDLMRQKQQGGGEVDDVRDAMAGLSVSGSRRPAKQSPASLGGVPSSSEKPQLNRRGGDSSASVSTEENGEATQGDFLRQRRMKAHHQPTAESKTSSSRSSKPSSKSTTRTRVGRMLGK